MKVLISTPCHGGQVMDEYASALLITLSDLRNKHPDIEVQIHFQGKESLIHRARNRAAMLFYEGGFDKLFTIDADVVFTAADFERIVMSDKPVIGGIYPLKTFPIVMNFNPLPEKGTELFSSHRGFDHEAWGKFVHKYADSAGLVEVRHVATGFMCVTREVFAKLSETCEVYWDFASDTGERKGNFHFYPSQVKNGSLLSEDWFFTESAREAGFPVFLDTRVTLGHKGNHTYRLGQFYGEAKD